VGHTDSKGTVVTPDKIRVDPILDAAPGTDTASDTGIGWMLPTTCTDCGTVGLVVIPVWSLGDALCLPCVVRLEVTAEVDAALDHRLVGRRYAARVTRGPGGRRPVDA